MSSALENLGGHKENTPPSKASKNMITYSCPMCDKKFPFNFHLQRHIASTHRSAKRATKPLSSDNVDTTPKRACSRQSGVGHECEFCGQRFNLPLSLQQHMETKHPNGPRKSDTIRALQTGVLHQCDQCGKWFPFTCQLRDHIEAKHTVATPERRGRPRLHPQPAKKTPAVEKSVSPIIRQKMNKEQVCKACDKEFSNYHNFLRHVKNVHKIDCGPEDGEMVEDYQLTELGEPTFVGSTKQFAAAEDTSYKPQRFACPHCHKEFKLNFLLQRHMESAHPEGSSAPAKSVQTESANTDPSIRCDLCGETFKLNFHLRRHIAKAHASAHFRLIGGKKMVAAEPTTPSNKDKSPKCTHCGKTFKLNIQLRRHLKVEHNDTESPLPGDGDGHRGTTTTVAKKRPGPKPGRPKSRVTSRRGVGDDDDSDDQAYQDNEEADANYSPSADRKTSPRSAVPKERLRWICQYCKRAFAYNYYLQKHIATRHSEIPDSERLSCKHCGMSFKMNILLRRHIMSQHPEFATPDTLPKPPPRHEYPCTVCGMMFDRNTHLRRHISIAHDGNHTPACEPCGKTFFNYLAYMRHMSAVHKTLRSDPCPICDKRFTVNANLRRHIATVHEKLKFASCDICGKHFTQTHNLKVHMETHNRHLLRVIEESEEVDLPDPGSDVDQQLEDQLQNGSLLRPEDIETVEAITLELPSSSSEGEGEEDGEQRTSLAKEGGANRAAGEVEGKGFSSGGRQMVRGTVSETVLHDVVHNQSRLKKRMKRRRPSDWTAAGGDDESDGVPSSAVARRQHAVFMRKPIDLSRPVPVADHKSGEIQRATAAVYTTYMLA